MFRHSKAISSFSANNIDEAKQFYSQVLEMEVVENEMGLLELRIENGSVILIYPSDNHVPATFTVLNFPVDDIDKAVEMLKERNIKLEHYDLPGLQTDGKGISRGNPSVAWFKDPAGNILSVIQEGSDKAEV